MPLLYTCPQGHHWEAEAAPTAPACPSCGQEHSSVVDSNPGDRTSAAGDALPPRPSPVFPAPPGYEIICELGRGGMGVVYKARQVNLNREVALKMLLRGSDPGSNEAARFRAEAEAVARLHHPHIVQVHDIGEHGGQLYFALEYMEGGGLNRKLAGRPQPPAEAAALVETLARAVHHAHGRGVVHRDLKPANVLLGSEGLAKIADFGLAKLLDASGRTAEGTVLGTASYMAPEQAQGQSGRVGPAADIWALGAILYEMLTGRPPFRGDTMLSTLAQLLTVEPQPPRQVNPGVPARLEAICLRCLRKDPAERYPSAEALADDLRRFLADAAPALPPPRRRRIWLRAGAAAACLALLLVAFGAGWRLLTTPADGTTKTGGPGAGTPVAPAVPPRPSAGAHWEVFTIGDGGEVFDRIAFPSRQVGYAASRQKLYKTTDGGRAWAPIHTPPAPHPVYVLLFEDERTGWMSSDRLYHTDDGGERWAPVPLPAEAVVRSLAIGPNGRALAAGREGDDLVMFRRNDSGAAWEKLAGHYDGSYWGWPTPGEGYRHWFPGDVTILDANVALLSLFGGAEDEGAVLRSRDGGDHWQALGRAAGGDVYNVRRIDADRAWFAGSHGALGLIDASHEAYVERTNPAGATISRLAFDPHGSGFGLAPVWKGSVLLTKDGKDWSLVQVDLEYATPDAVVVDPGWAFVLGSEGRIARYVDPSVPEAK